MFTFKLLIIYTSIINKSIAFYSSLLPGINIFIYIYSSIRTILFPTLRTSIDIDIFLITVLDRIFLR